MIENIAIGCCLSVDCTLLIYFWGALSQGPLAIGHLVISRQVQTFV